MHTIRNLGWVVSATLFVGCAGTTEVTREATPAPAAPAVEVAPRDSAPMPAAPAVETDVAAPMPVADEVVPDPVAVEPVAAPDADPVMEPVGQDDGTAVDTTQAGMQAVYDAMRADIRAGDLPRAEARFESMEPHLEVGAEDPRHEIAEDLRLLGGFVRSMLARGTDG